MAKNYTIVVTATMNDLAMSTDTLEIKLAVLPAATVPYLTVAPIDLTVMQGTSISYELSSTYDSGGASVSITIASD